ncbi:unnamed protein product, partial [Rotaria sordida]
SRSPSPTSEQKDQRSRSPSPSSEQKDQRSRSPSPTSEQKDQRSRSPSPTSGQKDQRSRSPSPTSEQKDQRSRSPSHTSEQKDQRSRSPSPTSGQKDQHSRSPSPTSEQKDQRSRSPSAIKGEEEQQGIMGVVSSIVNEHQVASQYSSSDAEQKGQGSRKTSVDMEMKQPIIDNEQKPESDLFTSAINGNERRSSSQEIDDDVINPAISKPPLSLSALSEELEKNKSAQSSLDFTHETTHNLTENVARSQMMESEKEDYDRSIVPRITDKHHQEEEEEENVMQSFSPLSFTNENKLSGEEDYNSKETDENRHVLTKNDEQLKESSMSSPLTEKHVEEPWLIVSPTAISPSTEDRQDVSFINIKDENQNSSMISSSAALHGESHSSETIKSPVKESIPSSILENQGTISPTSTIHQELPNISHSPSLIPSKPSETIEHVSSKRPSSFEHDVESDPFPNLLLSDVDRSSITPRQSPSAIIRPNTLAFSPNDHDLDGLYLSNDYDDENEISANNEDHHNSASSTVHEEYHPSSPLHKNNVEEQHTPIDPNDVSKTLSIVEKSRIEDSDNSGVDSTDSRNT